MQALTIPEPYRLGLQKLVALDESESEELATIVKAEQPTLDRNDLTRHTAARLSAESSISSRDITDIVDSILALYSVRTFFSMTPAEFAAAVCDSGSLEIPDARRKDFERVLADLLDSESLLVTSKAMNVLTEEAHTFHGARIITDIRPIFREDPENGPAAAVIVQLLKISYHEGRQLRDFFVLLDGPDVMTLRKVLDRADAKAKSLESVLSSAHLPYLEMKER